MCLLHLSTRWQNFERRPLVSSCPFVCSSIRPSVRMEQLGSHSIFAKHVIWVILENLWRKFEIQYNLTRITATLHEDQYTFLIIPRLLLKWEMFQAKVVENIKSCRLWGNVEKFCTARQATDGNMAHARCMLNTEGYRHPLRICKFIAFSTATMVAETRINFMLYVHTLSCSLWKRITFPSFVMLHCTSKLWLWTMGSGKEKEITVS